jgi:alkylation response protein AidB-like acyl-CoA dehydrogenase
VDYGWPTEWADLADRARKFAEAAAERLGAVDDCWLVGHSREFTRMLADQGWIGKTWPRHLGGDERPEIER